MKKNVISFISFFSVMLLTMILTMILSTSCSKFRNDVPESLKIQEGDLSKSIDSLMVNSRWNFEKLCFDSIGPQLVFNDSIKTMFNYNRLIGKDGFIDTLIQKYNLLKDNSYLPGYSSGWDKSEFLHFRYELILSQDEILNMIGVKRIELLKIVTRKYSSKYGQYIQPFFARASGACLTSRLLKNIGYTQFIEELTRNPKFTSIILFSEPIEDIEDSISYQKINKLGIDFLQSIK